MKFRKRNNEVPGLNTTSTADISFMLLVFFLVTTSMYVDKGLQRRLPPKDKKDKKEVTIDASNMLSLKLNAEGQLLVNDSLVAFADLKGRIEDFVQAKGKEHVVVIESDPNCRYESYFMLQQALGDAYTEVRETAAQKQYGMKLSELTGIDREKLLNEYPQRIAEKYEEESNMERRDQ